MFYTRYRGSFLSIDGVAWTVCIQQDAARDFNTVEELEFSVPSLEIDWVETSQEMSVCSSRATLRLICPSDRAYLDLYSVAPCVFRLLVFRSGDLFWSGTLDPEFSEEPYSTADGYVVSLTFSDFGVLNRISYNLSGLQTLSAILTDALTRACLLYESVDQSRISTILDGNQATLDRISILSGNFFDEDGEPTNMRDVLEGMLQPLGIRLIQRSGSMYLYDLNGLCAAVASTPIQWMSNDQTLSSDKVFNAIKISLSTYAGGDSTPEFKYTGDHSPDKINISNNTPSDGDYYSFYEDWGLAADSHWDYDNIDFTIFRGGSTGLASYMGTAFHIEPVLGGEESSGVAMWFYTGGHGSLQGGWPVRKGMSTVPPDGTPFLQTQRIYLPPLSSAEAKKYRIRLQVPMMIDARYNPFAEAGDNNEKENSDLFRQVTDAIVAAKVQLYDASGNVTKHYSNKDLFDSNVIGGTPLICTLARTIGKWESGAAAYNDCLLHWYDINTPLEAAIQGWHTNRQGAGFYRVIYPSFRKMADGQYMPYPEDGGWLEVSLCGLGLVSNRVLAVEDVTSSIMSKARWWLFQAPVMEIIKGDVTLSSLDASDVEYKGTLNADAKDDLELETICGTMKDPLPSAKALYRRSTDGSIISTLTRAGRTTQAEQLLIGTLHSQFASRKVRLSGTAAPVPGAPGLLTDAAMDGSMKMFCIAELHSIREAESKITAVEIRPDEYVSNDD